MKYSELERKKNGCYKVGDGGRHPIWYSPITGKEFVESKFEFVYDVASFLNYYSKILTIAGLERVSGVNQGQLSHYVTGHRKPGKKPVEKIEQNLHRFADELKEVEFK